jgi:hypothetical protein
LRNSVCLVIHVLFAPIAHEVDLLRGLNRRTSIAAPRDRDTDIYIAVKAPSACGLQFLDAIAVRAAFFVAFLRIPIMSAGMINEL